jgi:hypothetical protein
MEDMKHPSRPDDMFISDSARYIRTLLTAHDALVALVRWIGNIEAWTFTDDPEWHALPEWVREEIDA